MRLMLILFLASPALAGDIDWLSASRPIQGPPVGVLLSKEVYSYGGRTLALEEWSDARQPAKTPPIPAPQASTQAVVTYAVPPVYVAPPVFAPPVYVSPPVYYRPRLFGGPIMAGESCANGQCR